MIDHSRWQAWFEGESEYQAKKFGSQRHIHDKYMETEGVAADGLWHHDINAYLHRANILGLRNPSGRQALAKAAMVVIAAVESAERVYGPLPEPGHTSGEIVEWKL